MDITTVRKWSVLLASVVALPVSAAQWDFIPTIKLQEMYSSNIERRRSHDETESFVTELTPGFIMSGFGPNLQANLNYGVTGLYYTDDSDANTSHHKANGNISYSPWRPLTLYSSALFDQAITDLDRGLSNDISSRQGNISDRKLLVVGTRYSNEHAGWAIVDADANYRWVDAEDELDATDGHNINLTANQGDRFDRAFWQLTYTDARESSDLGTAFHTVYGQAQVGYMLWKWLGAYTRYSYDDNSFASSDDETLKSYGAGVRISTGPQFILDVGYNSVDEGDQDDFWNASVSWLPTPLTAVIASYDRRFYGETYGLQLSHGTRKLRNEIRYDESFTTFSQSSNSIFNLNFWCPLGVDSLDASCSLADPSQSVPPDQQQITEDIPVSSISNQVYLNKQWSWTSSVKARSDTFALTAFHSSREYERTEGVNQTDRDTGVAFTWDKRLNERSKLNNRAVYRRYDAGANDGHDNEWSIRSGYIRQMWPSASATFAAEYNTRESYNGGTDFDEIRLIASMAAQF
ncbi:TIGR03016 family PEP-CTERM system-associated outer membrane protein [Corallincola platygyrae]|uniref:TIGR03016 family PEP-CTERM system-associated outer membrane protein n=1 Tax=Corallincola platygyrae TaxID=1193278 RepID=A0ABW4XLK1_9GAMM